MTAYARILAEELHLREPQVATALQLLAEGNTIPFVARYRKEATGELDEVQLRAIRDRAEYLTELDARREAVRESIESQDKLTPELRDRLARASTKAEIEDLYRPFKQTRRTRGQIAIERGLEPLADLLLRSGSSEEQIQRLARELAAKNPDLPDAESALAGAADVIAERIANDPDFRTFARRLTRSQGKLRSRKSRKAGPDAEKFRDYFDFVQPLKAVPGHRALAIRRGEAEGALSVGIDAPEDEIIAGLLRRLSPGRAGKRAGDALTDGYRRLMAPSIETELRSDLHQTADEEAIAIFGSNLEALLLAPPAGRRTTLGVDPGFRTGCKLAVVNATGALLATGVTYLHQTDRAIAEIQRLIDAHGVKLIGIGNGTASRESMDLVRTAIGALPEGSQPEIALVNEAGASVYSASDSAREELPDLDLTLRSAVSIARRLQDPLSELVKIDPKAIGVGQYQHDVPQNRLKQRLDETVASCVNRVGVELNTASETLLAYVAGIGPGLARKMVEHRDQNGAYHSRKSILEVAGLGPRTFEQAAGFLRVRDAHNPLDRSAVHPERYNLVSRMAADVGTGLDELVGNSEVIDRIDFASYESASVGRSTLRDIEAELRKPGRDPRDEFEPIEFRDDVTRPEDLEVGMVLAGTVTNVVAFGAFVDIGVHQDGLVHISKLADHFVSDPNAVVRPGDRVRVAVATVDLARNRIGLSMRRDDTG